MNPTIAYRAGPIVFLDSGHASSAKCGCTDRLIRELGQATDVVTLDVCGGGSEHLMNVNNTGPSILPPFPIQPYMTAIGGKIELSALAKGTLAVGPWSTLSVSEAVSRLRRALNEIQPRAVCVDDEQALFVAWLALPPDLPLVYLVTSELHGIRSDCAPAWCRVDAALGVSEYSLRYLRSTHYAHQNLHVVGSGIDVERLLAQVGAQMGGEHSRRAPVQDVHAPVQVNGTRTLSVLSPVPFPRPLKGHQVGMQAIANLNRMGVPAELWLCEQEYRFRRSSHAQIADLAVELGVQEHVRILGHRSSQPSTLARSDVALLLSCTPERHQLILEAMALTKPVVVTRTGSAPELVRDGVDGILVEPGDVGATVQALQRLSDPELRARMGAAGQRRARVEFSPRRQIDRFLGALDTVIEPNRFARDWLFN
jgi:glycosyltransferase involved in cell wall biosynthesis